MEFEQTEKPEAELLKKRHGGLIGAAAINRVAAYGDEPLHCPATRLGWCLFAYGSPRQSARKRIEMVYAIDFLDEAKASIKRLSPDVSSRILK